MQFHVISFEGPDPYARAGGISSRVTGLSEALADAGLETHVWFVGDPYLPGHEAKGRLHMHRWCQWISAHHPGGVYDGEEGKRPDFTASLPPFLIERALSPFLRRSEEPAVVLAEEWHTADAVVHLDGLLRRAGLRDRVAMFWNANNTFGFHRIDWRRLDQAAIITTVSRYMRYRMWEEGVDPLVIPNGLSADALRKPAKEEVACFRRRFKGRIVFGKVARFDPDKRWLLAMDTVAELKRRGKRPLLIARGGVEGHCYEVLHRAAERGLRVVERNGSGGGPSELLSSLEGLEGADVVSLRSHLDAPARRVLFRAADAILANSGHEPFGLVGLETMAVGGLACTGGTGEDYAVPGWNALVLQSNDPAEFVTLFNRVQMNPRQMRDIRRHAMYTARQHTWPAIVHRNLLPRVASIAARAGQRYLPAAC